MKKSSPQKNLIKRHLLFPFLFVSLFLALLTSSVAIIQQQRVYKTQAACQTKQCSNFSQGDCTKHKGCRLGNCSGRYCKCLGTTQDCSSPPAAAPKKCGDYAQADCTKHQGCRLDNCSGRYCKCVGTPSGGGGGGGGGISCGGEGQRCCTSSPYDPKPQGDFCNNSSLKCTPSGYGVSVCIKEVQPKPAPATSDICRAKGESACYIGKCPDGKASAGEGNCGANAICCKMVQTSACKDQGGTCLDDCAPFGKNPTNNGACWGGKKCCVKPAGAPAPGGGAPATGGGGGGTPSDKAPTATNTPPPPTATPTPKQGEVVLDLKLKFQGITKQPVNNSMEIAVSLDSNKTDTGTFTADSNGVWSGKVSFSGVDLSKKYSVYVKGPKHLQKRICVTSPSESNPGRYSCNTDGISLTNGTNTFNFSNILLLAGDLPDQDGVADSSDISFVRQHLSSTDPDDLEIGDVNLDGVINTQDFALVLAALGVKTDDALN